jgi:hypothetical protein
MARDKCAAVVTIHRAPEMSKSGRKRIATWLRAQAMFLEQNSKQLSSRYTARYLYR